MRMRTNPWAPIVATRGAGVCSSARVSISAGTAASPSWPSTAAASGRPCIALDDFDCTCTRPMLVRAIPARYGNAARVPGPIRDQAASASDRAASSSPCRAASSAGRTASRGPPTRHNATAAPARTAGILVRQRRGQRRHGPLPLGPQPAQRPRRADAHRRVALLEGADHLLRRPLVTPGGRHPDPIRIRSPIAADRNAHLRRMPMEVTISGLYG